MQTTILFNTPMRIDSIFQSASVIEFQEHGNIHNTMFVRLDVEPYAPHIVCATDRTEYIAVTISRDGTVWANTTTGTRPPHPNTLHSARERRAHTGRGNVGWFPLSLLRKRGRHFR